MSAKTRHGESAEHHRYDAYGGVLSSSGATTGDRPSPVSQGYTGHEHEEEIGLVNMGGRIYSPRLRRFLTADPIVASPFGQGLNAYSYVRGNPLNPTHPHLYPNGSNYHRLNPAGHGPNGSPHGHGHLQGTGPNMKGQGDSIDPFGNVVPWTSTSAHWTIL
ncbi:MAG: RHS repeat-associated core domain-containing protein [Sandaracinus sp.]